jgi:hypothetical protein
MKKLDLSLWISTPMDIKYIMKMFPNLEYLYIEHLTNIVWTSDQERQEVAKSFRDYAVKLKRTNFTIDSQDEANFTTDLT